MPADPYEERKRYYEVKLMEAQLEKILDEREKIRADLEESRMRWEKGLHDMKMDEKRFNQQWWTVLVAGLGAIAAWATWWTAHGAH